MFSWLDLTWFSWCQKPSALRAVFELKEEKGGNKIFLSSLLREMSHHGCVSGPNLTQPLSGPHPIPNWVLTAQKMPSSLGPIKVVSQPLSLERVFIADLCRLCDMQGACLGSVSLGLLCHLTWRMRAPTKVKLSFQSCPAMLWMKEGSRGNP